MEILTPLLWLTLTVFYEAGGEEDLGQIAVTHVILNRVRESGTSIKEVVLKSKQFSCFNNGVRLPKDWGLLKSVQKNVLIALNGYNFIKEVEFYHKIGCKPYWANVFKLVGVIGNHAFYRED